MTTPYTLRRIADDLDLLLGHCASDDAVTVPLRMAHHWLDTLREALADG